MLIKEYQKLGVNQVTLNRNNNLIFSQLKSAIMMEQESRPAAYIRPGGDMNCIYQAAATTAGGYGYTPLPAPLPAHSHHTVESRGEQW